MLPKISLVVIGHKDHGKSTLIGRLLYDSKAILEQKLEEIRTELERSGKKEFEFAFLLDSLEEERKGGLTIDIMQTPFRSKKYFYTIIDCPGHREFIKKMLTGASQADAAVLVVSAKEGIEDQTKQHAFLAKTLGISQLVVAINKMDQVGYQKTVFAKTCQILDDILKPLGFDNVSTVPISAFNGDNVFTESQNMKWYNGQTLIDTLDNTVKPIQSPWNKPLRGCVQDVYKQENNEIVICKIATGILEAGKMVYFSPSAKKGTVKAIEMFDDPRESAKPGDSVGVVIDGVRDVQRGEVISYLENPAREAKSFIAEIILFSDVKIKNGDVTTIRCGTAERRCRVEKILTEIDPVNLTVKATSPETLEAGSVGEVKFSPLEPMCVEKHSDFPSLGRFVIEGKKGSVGGGIVLNVEWDKIRALSLHNASKKLFGEARQCKP
jgi:elongation factor 1-alpha